jgi:hypothetical protein
VKNQTYTRKPSGVKLNTNCMNDIDALRKAKGWTKYHPDWYESAKVSESTLKRFWARESLSPENFKNICLAVGKEDWQKAFESEGKSTDLDSTRVPSLTHVIGISVPRSELETTKFKITVRGTSIFDEDAIILVRDCLEELSEFFSTYFPSLEQLTSSEMVIAKWRIDVMGVGILSEDGSYTVEGILNSLQSLFGQQLRVKIKIVEDAETVLITAPPSPTQTFPESKAEQEINILSHLATAA